MQWPRSDFKSMCDFYGDFRHKSWASTHLTRIRTPFALFYDGKPMLKGILCHELVADAMLRAFYQIWDECGHDQNRIDASGASEYSGCFNIRKIAGSENYSTHSWAASIDLAASKNGFRFDKSTTLDRCVIAAFKRQGAFWGGDYKGRKDPMHFEFVSR